MWIARRVQASLTPLHSDRPDEHWNPDTKQFVPGEGTRAGRQKALEAVVAEVSKGGIAAKGVIRSEPAWLAIIQEVLREDIDAVVAAKRTDVQSDERKLGTIARKLLRKCPCAVWLEDPRESVDPAVILAATDLTAVGDRVVELAASVAHALGAQLHVVHACSMSIEAQLEGSEARREWERDQIAAAREHIQNVLASTLIKGAAKLHVGVNSPTQAILQGVEALRPGLVVMGTVSRGGVPGFLMGNTAERLIDRIDCALLTETRGFRMSDRAASSQLSRSGASAFAWLFALPLALACGTGEPSAQMGDILYQRHCASCHGESGKGDGPVAVGLRTPPADLTTLAARNGGRFDESRVMRIIDGRRVVAEHGTREMPVWGAVFTHELQAKRATAYTVLLHGRALTDYVRGLQQGQ